MASRRCGIGFPQCRRDAAGVGLPGGWPAVRRVVIGCRVICLAAAGTRRCFSGGSPYHGGMKWFRVGVAAVLALWVAGCATWGPVRTAQDPEVDLAGYRTFALLPIPEDLSTADPAMGARVAPVISNTVHTVMVQKGYQPAALELADLAVYVRGKTVPHLDVTKLGYLPYYGRIGWTKSYPYPYGYNLADTHTFEEGTFIVEVYDNRTKKMIWVGWTSTGRPPGGSKEAARVAQALEQILENYPPAAPAQPSSTP